jgi:hypothetical protein
MLSVGTESGEVDMKELMADYSGSFDRNFSHGKLAQETLANVMKATAEYMRRIDGYWYLSVMEKWGNDEALDCDIKVWEKLVLYEMRMLSNLLNIHGDNVVTVMKALQASPWALTYACDIDVTNDDYAIVTYRNCPTLLALEKEGQGREGLICRELEPKMMNSIAHYFNPDIEVTALQLPPREGNSDICCQWEFKLDR